MTLLWMISSFVRWLRLKHYQYEVTFAVYMLTPTEKVIFSMSPPEWRKSRIYIYRPLQKLIAINRHPPPLPRLDDFRLPLCLPPRPHSTHLRSSLLLLGRRASVHLRQSSIDQFRLSRQWHPEPGGHVRDGQERRGHGDQHNCRIMNVPFMMGQSICGIACLAFVISRRDDTFGAFFSLLYLSLL